jgi:hypothetical protein
VGDEKLKPCPFCGKKPEKPWYDWNGTNDYWVECPSKRCRVKPATKKYRKPEQAITAWNKRVKGD